VRVQLDGVFIPAEWCGEVGAAVGDYVRRQWPTSPALLRLAEELAVVASEVSDPGSREWYQPVSAPHTQGMTVSAYAKHIGRSERRVRQLIAEGHLPANQPGGPGTQWTILEEKTK
jgi:hypothetical protein